MPERTSRCPCCGRPKHSGCGAVVEDGEEVASYWYDWPEGHEGMFGIGVAWSDPRWVATALGEATAEGITYTVLDRERSPFGEMDDYGTHLDRSELLGLPETETFWRYVNAVVAQEPNLKPRVLIATRLAALQIG